MSAYRVPIPLNEPVRSYAPGTAERQALKQKIAAMSAEKIEIPLIIGGKEVRTGDTATQVMPHRHGHVLATWHKAGPKEVEQAIKAATDARREWGSWTFEDRASVFLRAGELLASTWRETIGASTMLNQSKTVHQSDIDAVCETIDFLRFNVHFAEQIYDNQPINSPGMWNRVDYRPLEGFIYSVTPFNFTSIGGNLSSSPALMGNGVLWKPASSTVFSNYYIFKLFEAAGLPPGVINFIPGNPSTISEVALNHPELAGIHFTGSTEVFQGMWRTVGENIKKYKTYPRLVGETGGKDFILAHTSADPDALITAIVRGGFEYQGQKCSAASRMYIPGNLVPEMGEALAEQVSEIRMGDVRDFRNFMGAVIDKPSFTTQKEAVELATGAADASVVVGGETDDSKGWFVSPTVVETSDPGFDLMRRELFGPVV